MKTKLTNMRLEVIVEAGDVIDEKIVYHGSPYKIVKYLAQHEWGQLIYTAEHV